jgi:hypothetical protein
MPIKSIGIAENDRFLQKKWSYNGLAVKSAIPIIVVPTELEMHGFFGSSQAPIQWTKPREFEAGGMVKQCFLRA